MAEIDEDELIVSTASGDMGSVHYWSYISPGWGAGRVESVAPTIGSFLARLADLHSINDDPPE